MHELLQDVLPWLAALYLLDGLVRVGRGHLVVAGAWPGRGRALGPGLHLAALSPAAEVVRALDALVVPGVASLHRRAGDARWDPRVLGPDDLAAEPWPAPEAIGGEGARVTVAGRPAIRTASPEQARELAGALQRIASSPAAARAAAIAVEVERAGADVAAAMARCRAPRRLLAFAGAVAFLAWFAVLPVAAFGGPLAATALVPALALAVAAHVLVVTGGAWLSRRAGKTWGTTIATLAPIAMFPPLGARALAHVGRDLHARYDGAALAIALLAPAEVEPFARERLARARRATALLAGGDAATWAAARERSLARAAEGRGLDPRALLRAPAAERDAAAFCPVCAAQFRRVVERCPDCDVAVEPFAPAKGRRREGGRAAARRPAADA